jgi:ribosome-associated translation inhibitor RaiA
MRLRITAKAVKLSRSLEENVSERFRKALDRLKDHVDRLKVVLVSEKRRRGGRNMECIVHANMHSMGELTIRERDPDLLAAVSKAASRSAHSLSRKVARRRRIRRASTAEAFMSMQETT